MLDFDIQDISLEIALVDDLPQIVDIYNWYVENSAVTFDLERVTAESRLGWFEQFKSDSRHQIWLAKSGTQVLGYAASMAFRTKAAYDPSVENSVYLRPDAMGLGLGKKLMSHLLSQLAKQDVHRVLACITLPNDVSVALHKNLGFKQVGVFSEVGRKFERYHDVAWLECEMANYKC